MTKENEFWFEENAIDYDASCTVCKFDSKGRYHSYRCNVFHSKVGSVWERKVDKKVRKVFIAKNTDQGGGERLQIWQGENLILDQMITPGTRGNFLNNEIQDIRIKVTTSKLNSSSNSSYYIHIEWYS